MKKALITGISGQDGSYLAEYLLGLGYEVWGLVRREPATVATAEPDPFGLDLGLLGEMAEAAAADVQVTPAFALATALGVAALPVGLGASVQVREDWKEPAILQVAVIAAPSDLNARVSRFPSPRGTEMLPNGGRLCFGRAVTEARTRSTKDRHACDSRCRPGRGGRSIWCAQGPAKLAIA